jgi:tripartite-type tricarboxylate transporter receptor subunit TctC
MTRLLISAVLLALALPVSAQYPTKPVRLICPFPAGGAADNTTRIVARGLAEAFGQQVIVDNRPGGDGVLAANALMQSAPDGHTLLLGTATGMTAMPATRKNPPYDAITDFTPISLIGHFTHLLLVHPDVPAKTLAEFVAYAKANPGKLNYATTNLSANAGTIQLMKSTGIVMTHVPYKGSAQSIPDLITGRVQVSFDSSLNLFLGQVKAGKLRILATMMQHRSPQAPDAPTLPEVGIPAVTTAPWGGLFGPAKMDRAIAERLSREVNGLIAQAEARQRLYEQGIEPEASATPGEFVAFLKSQATEWRRLVQEGAFPVD